MNDAQLQKFLDLQQQQLTKLTEVMERLSDLAEASTKANECYSI